MELFIIILILTGVYTEALFQHNRNGSRDTDDADKSERQLDDEVNQEKEPIRKVSKFDNYNSFHDLHLNFTDRRHNMAVHKEAERYPPEAKDPPQTTIYTRDEVRLGSENTLICFTTRFYPPRLGVRWTKNNENVTEGVSLSRYYPNDDDTFHHFSTLRFTPGKGDIYSCTVEHQALSRPQTRVWEHTVKKPNVGPSVFCGVSLAIGMLGVATGTFFLVRGNNCCR